VPGGIPGASWEAYAGLVARYYGHVTMIDHQMGRVLDALDRLALSDNTIVVFTSDHGILKGSHGLLLMGACCYDELYHIPLTVWWPDEVSPGAVCDDFVHLFDLMPTFLEAAGIAPPEGIDARSLVPLLHGDTPQDWPKEIFAEWLATEAGSIVQKILRTRAHKLSLNTPDPDELFDLENDPGELNNVINDPVCTAARAGLASRLRQRMAASNDPMLPELGGRLGAYTSCTGQPDP